LVAELNVVNITRRAGARQYETTITATERIHALLSRAGCSPSKDQGAIDASEVHGAVRNLLLRTTTFSEDREYKFWEAKAVAQPDDPSNTNRTLPANRRVVDLLKDIAARMERESNSFGRGMLLIRNGKLHIGKRPIPLDPDKPDPKPLT